MRSRVWRWPMSLSASSDRPLMSAASPTTTTICSIPWRRSRAVASPSAIESPVPAWPPSNTSCGDSVRRGNPPTPSIWRSDPKRSSRPVRSLCGYAWWPVSQTILSRGESRRRWRAIVSSTTPSELPRWPPVRATVETIVWRSSAASSVSWASVRPRRSAGPVSVGRIAIWSAPGAVCGLATHRRAAEWTLDLGRL